MMSRALNAILKSYLTFVDNFIVNQQIIPQFIGSFEIAVILDFARSVILLVEII